MLAARMAYARKGIRTSPADTAKKKPHLKGWQEKATTNPQQITAESNRWPDAGILTPTGSLDGRLVIDEDVPGELERLERELRVPLRGITTEVRTPSGMIHAHFSLPEGIEVDGSVGKNVGDGFVGLDVRGKGNMVLLPPTASYTFANRLPMAEAPPELTEWAGSRRKAKAPEGAGKRGTGTGIHLEPGAVVPLHSRNWAIVRFIGASHDGRRSLEDLITMGIAYRDASFEEPASFPDEEIAKVARWIVGKPPCRRRKKREPNPEVEEALGACSDYWYTQRLPGGGRSKVRDVYRAALKSAAKRSEMVEALVDGEVVEGPAFSDSCRQLAEVANTSHMSVSRNLNRLEELGALTKIDAPEGLARTYILTPTKTNPRTGVTPPGQPSASPIGKRLVRGVTVARADELNVPFFGWRSPTGNSRAGAWAAMEAFGPQTEEELAESLGISRPRDVRRRILEPMEELRAAVRDGETWSLPNDHERVTDSLWHEPYATVTRRRERTRTAEGRVVTAVEEYVTVASDAERVEAIRERHRKDRELFAQHLREAAERAEEELRQEDEIRGFLNVWDDERQALAVADADGFVGELEPVEEAVGGPVEMPEVPEVPEVFVDAGDDLTGQERPQMGHTDDAHTRHIDRPLGGVPYYRETTEILPESGGLSDLAMALGRYLDLNPGRSNESPSWLGIALWAEGYTEGKPDEASVACAMGELDRVRRIGAAA